MKYVIPSHPQTGVSSFGHTTGKGRHDPAGAPHVGRSQKEPAGQSSASTHRGPVAGGPPPSTAGIVASTTASSVQAAVAAAMTSVQARTHFMVRPTR